MKTIRKAMSQEIQHIFYDFFNSLHSLLHSMYYCVCVFPATSHCFWFCSGLPGMRGEKGERLRDFKKVLRDYG